MEPKLPTQPLGFFFAFNVLFDALVAPTTVMLMTLSLSGTQFRFSNRNRLVSALIRFTAMKMGSCGCISYL
ncbi:hypothetical protein ACXJY6_12690 [Vibrio sp. RC27]